MIINKFVFPIKADKKFVGGSLPQGYLTANDINKDMFYVISPSVGQTVITAMFQNTLQTDEPELVKLVPSDEPINMLVNKNASYYELVKEWNVWQGVFPSKALEYVAFNRAGEIGISFSFSQRIIPKAPNISGVEYKGEIINKNFVPNVNGYWVVKLAEYEVYGVEYNYNDIITYFDGQAIKRSAITQSGNTDTVEYEVEPSVAGSDFEGVDPNITDLILQQLGEVTENIKFIKPKLGDFYTKDETYSREEIDNLVNYGGGGGYEPDGVTIVLNEEDKLKVSENLEIDGGTFI